MIRRLLAPGVGRSRATVTLCVLLWARKGRGDELVAYEDEVLRLIPEHGGKVLQRARSAEEGAHPLEVHVLEFPSEAALQAYTNDDRRTSLAADRDRAIARTEVIRVDLV